VKVLLDTHVFLWAISEPERLSPRARQAIEDPRNTRLVSAASAWEILIKVQAKRLKLPSNAAAFVTRQISQIAAEVLDIRMQHVLRILTLPALHRDPFDRMLIAQSQVERAPLITADPLMARYPVDIVW
jgi:PIN domain nuclease of toxin-antitoxin system